MKIKQYIVLRHEISPAVAVIATAHAVLGSYLKWQNEPIVQQWVNGIFYKVICQARDAKEWEMIKGWSDNIIFTESALDGLEVAVAFKPFAWSKSSRFNDLKLYGA